MPMMWQCVHKRVAPILCVVGHRTSCGSWLGIRHAGRQSLADCESSLSLAIASAAYGGLLCGASGFAEVLHAAAGMPHYG